MLYGLIGEKLSHSFSKEIHGRLADYDYTLTEIEPQKLETFFTERDFCGLNVTVPYKTEVIKFLDEIDTAAAQIGAVNTVVNRGGKLYGYNTDAEGLTALIKKNGIEISGKKVLILGSGGTSKTALYVANSMGAKSVIRVSRAEKEGFITYGEALSSQNDADVIINTTPCGMFPSAGDTPIDLTFFSRLNAVVDVIYNPLKTRLVIEAQTRGIKAVGGLY
ncbi:MAG: shikimate dehydrogenase, partial [Clostridia bacterium]|nr:shikimate dehydrogenase [Clostridia bacterium]